MGSKEVGCNEYWSPCHNNININPPPSPSKSHRKPLEVGEKLFEIPIEVRFDLGRTQRHVLIRTFKGQLFAIIVQNTE